MIQKDDVKGEKIAEAAMNLLANLALDPVAKIENSSSGDSFLKLRE
jgi:hypothetical protein